MKEEDQTMENSPTSKDQLSRIYCDKEEFWEEKVKKGP